MQDKPILRFGLSPLKKLTSFRRGWVNSTFVHGFIHPVTKTEQLLLWDLRQVARLNDSN